MTFSPPGAMSGYTLVLGVFLAGGFGSVLRWGTVQAAASVAGVLGGGIAGLLLCNTMGSFVAGVFLGWPLKFLDAQWRTILFAGLLGGYTSFSALSADTARLIQDQRHLTGWTVGLGSVVLGVAALVLGLALGRWLAGR